MTTAILKRVICVSGLYTSLHLFSEAHTSSRGKLGECRSMNYGILLLVLLLLRVMVWAVQPISISHARQSFPGLYFLLVYEYIIEFVSIFSQLSLYPDDLFSFISIHLFRFVTGTVVPVLN
jgi:hypothetical protein